MQVREYGGGMVLSFSKSIMCNMRMLWIVYVCVTILDQNLGACEAPVHSSHMQRALPFFILLNRENLHI